MKRLNRINAIPITLVALSFVNTAAAGEVKIVSADLHNSSANRWSLKVTLKHADTGWDHYADNWRVVDDGGNVLGERVLFHPHVDEQPFTRGLHGVTIPANIKTVYIEAHDTQHGWTPKRMKIELNKASGGRVRVETE